MSDKWPPQALAYDGHDGSRGEFLSFSFHFSAQLWTRPCPSSTRPRAPSPTKPTELSTASLGQAIDDTIYTHTKLASGLPETRTRLEDPSNVAQLHGSARKSILYERPHVLASVPEF